LSQPRRFGKPSSLLLCALALAGAPTGAMGAKATPDVAVDFHALAAQRPWTCADQRDTGLPRTGWSGGVAACAWQDRLRMRSWQGQGALAPGACVSAVAHWWAWARAPGPPPAGTPAAWQTSWPAQSIIDQRGPEQRIVLLRRLADGAWNVTEWRWTPSPRAATRRWQEGRWKLLAARAAQYRAPSQAPQGAPETRMLQRVLESNVGARVAEFGSQTWRWKADGLCLNVDAVGLGQQLMQLPYAIDDSRLEQRAAMQLQLARRYPKAVWLTNFSVLPAPPQARGGAKFHALWLDQALLKGQLWIPTKGDGPLVRVRVTTPLAPAADAQAVARAAQVVQGELAGLASRWEAAHE
jgi:hypothetical protein